ncbi:MAG: hypothetical protein HKP27_06130 [Myxococcales bacterium]|nr:hypothetical protein [Myxococcales bacterium]
MYERSLRFRRFARLTLLAGLLGCFFAGSAQAATIQIVDRGWFRDDGQHIAGSQNAFFGRWSGRNYRSFMVFDLSTVTDPISAATLELELESFWGNNASETFDVFDVSSDPATFQNAHAPGSASGNAIYADLGTGAVYATVTALSGDVGTVLSFALSAQAAADMEAARTGSGLFAMGFVVTTATGNQGLRWGTDADFDAGTVLTSQVVTSTPEPATAVMVGGCLAFLAWLASRQSGLVVA